MDLFSSAVFQRNFRYFNFTLYISFGWSVAVIQRTFVLSMFFVFDFVCRLCANWKSKIYSFFVCLKIWRFSLSLFWNFYGTNICAIRFYFLVSTCLFEKIAVYLANLVLLETSLNSNQHVNFNCFYLIL